MRETIKCPVCGSSAQVRIVWEGRDAYATQKENTYKCGCGCRFDAVFELKNIIVREDLMREG